VNAIEERKQTDDAVETRELYCGDCGYGIVIRRDPPPCPMCRATVWRERPTFVRWN
jgi:rubrerythrin